MQSSELLRLLKKDGWFEIRQSGSHITMAHPTKKGKVLLSFMLPKK
jgi:mRNA interferase HicA